MMARLSLGVLLLVLDDLSAFLLPSTSSSHSPLAPRQLSASFIGLGTSSSAVQDRRNLQSYSPTALFAKKKNDRKSNDKDEEEDFLDLNLSSHDWRSFRAKLVKGELTGKSPSDASANKKHSTSSSHGRHPQDECIPESGECDLDGIGEAFGVVSQPIKGIHKPSVFHDHGKHSHAPRPNSHRHPQQTHRPPYQQTNRPPRHQQNIHHPPPPPPPPGYDHLHPYYDLDEDGIDYPHDQHHYQHPPHDPFQSYNDPRHFREPRFDQPIHDHDHEEHASFQDMTPLDPSQWAFEQGSVIEQGAVILGAVEQDFGFGLRQQYFHKAAILVLDHDETTFTKGIILNRPTDLMLDDDVNPGVQWRVWFGGDVQGMESDSPDIVCLHRIKDQRAVDASLPVREELQWTTFDNAKQLVHAGVADPQDFWVFCGYAGWGPGQLLGELDRKSWHMVATDSGTLVNELARQSAGTDPRDAGLETWTLLMNMIGKGEVAEEYADEFDDFMLKEWALKHLMSAETGGGAGRRQSRSNSLLSRRKAEEEHLAHQQEVAHHVTPGTLLRASGSERSPFLLQEQELHKSVVLVLSDDDEVSIGAILNRPAAKGLDIQIANKQDEELGRITLPLRFGGQFAIKGEDNHQWLHCNSVLRMAGLGKPIGEDHIDGVWQCTADDVTLAISKGLAVPEDFFVVTGVTAWHKGEGGVGGIRGEVAKGNFEIVPENQVKDVWDALSRQEVLTNMNLVKNLEAANDAWLLGGENLRQRGRDYGAIDGHDRASRHHGHGYQDPWHQPGHHNQGNNWAPNGNQFAHTNWSAGRDYHHRTGPENNRRWDAIAANPNYGSNYREYNRHYRQEHEDSLVFKSDITVSKLSDVALRTWVATFLLGAPGLGR